ncbi:MAG: hypothetical protein Ct9H90mP24_3140 [Methanobacteriota archaeon]|nr:MAG: hypothetical protein Ct9H90mP24_3140 [Euryarchaeota archaeon]
MSNHHHERIERYLSLTAEAREKATPITSNKRIKTG